MKKLMYLFLILSIFTVSCGNTSKTPDPTVVASDIDYTNYKDFSSDKGYSFKYSKDWNFVDVATNTVTTSKGETKQVADFMAENSTTIDTKQLITLMSQCDAVFYSFKDSAYLGNTNIITQPNNGLTLKDISESAYMSAFENAFIDQLKAIDPNAAVVTPAKFETLGTTSYVLVEVSYDTPIGKIVSYSAHTVDDANMYVFGASYLETEVNYKEQFTNLLVSFTSTN